MDVYTDVILTLLTIVLGVLTILNFVNGRKKESKDSGAEMGAINQKLDNLVERTEEIHTDVKELRAASVETGKTLSAVQESAKSAHKRIDRLEERLQKLIDDNKKSAN